MYAQDAPEAATNDSSFVFIDSSAMRIDFLRYSLLQKQPLSNSEKKNNLRLPKYQLGGFCIFEKKLRNKTKLPLDFGTD